MTVICKWWKVYRIWIKVYRHEPAKKWANEILKRKWNAFEWKQRRPKHWPSSLACSSVVGCHFSPCIWCAHFVTIAFSHYYFRYSSGSDIVIRPSIRWSMHCSPKIFDSLSNESYANAFVPGQVLRKSLADAALICHKCEQAAEHRAFHRAPLPIRWMTAIIPVNIIQSWDDVHLLPALVQHVVQHLVLGADKIHSTNQTCMIFAIH